MPSTLSKVFFDRKKKQRDLWRSSPEHVWYPRKSPGATLRFEGSSLSCPESEEWLHYEVKYVSLGCCTDVAASFHKRAFLKTELSSSINKCNHQSVSYRQLALETFHKIPCDVLQIYCDGSMD
ncbi:hypothetical protein TNCV_2943261 [Trichonephila clavipes]|nr:hypothetical protein TNCV_2943261 [Trichonephila clavipes]